ncbi:MAG: nitroreductase family protein [Muribaculaceae bacterium]|nr:nitroreductase family protein [Muribaculaceae bacterium]
MKQIRNLTLAMMMTTAFFSGAEVLPAPQTTGGMPLMEAMAARQSSRDISPASQVSKQDLSNMLWAAWGVTHDGKRTIATAMNRQELILYVLTATEVSRYNPEDNTLTVVNTGDFRRDCARQEWAATAPINIALVVDTTKQEKEVFQAYTVGAASHNIYLYCASAGLKTVVRAMMDNKALTEALKLAPNERVLMVQTVGK